MEIDQLWYTWSNAGIDTLRAGFRIRAASEGLRDIYSPRMESLDRYQRYVLPVDVNPVFIEPEMAPTCLSLLYTDPTPEYNQSERILVYKTYSGKDGVGRYGKFFVHLLAGLREDDFSAKDAILLWKSEMPKSFSLRRSEAELDRRDTQLPRVPLATLTNENIQWVLPLSSRSIVDKKILGNNINIIKTYLPFLIQAYLTRRPAIDEQSGHTGRPKLYIAAQGDDDIALLIAGLTSCLPPQIQVMRDLTFSTYERDITKATTDIVGACGLSIRNPNSPPSFIQYVHEYNTAHVPSLLPDSYFREKLAINCFTGRMTPLENHPLLFNKPLASQYAQDAKRYLPLRYTKKFERFENEIKPLIYISYDAMKEAIKNDEDFQILAVFWILFEECLFYRSLDVDEFLDIYDRTRKFELPSPRMIDQRLRPRSLAEFRLTPIYLIAIVLQVCSDPNWWENSGKAAITYLRKLSTEQRMPQSAAILSQLAEYAVKQACGIVKRSPLVTGGPISNHLLTNEGATFERLEDLIFCAAPPQTPMESAISLSLLDELGAINDVLLFFKQHPDDYTQLMQLWGRLLPFSEEHYQRLKPLILLSWSGFAVFLGLGLLLDWNERVVRELLFLSPTPTKGELNDLRTAHNMLVPFMQQLAQDGRRWPTATDLFSKLAANGYEGKQDLLLTLLNSPMGRDEQHIRWLIQTAQMSDDEKVAFLEQIGPHYLPLPGISEVVLKLFEELARSGSSADKMRILLAWFGSAELSSWFAMPKKKGERQDAVLTAILQAAHLHTTEAGQFLSQYGQSYLYLYPSLQVLWELYTRYSATGAQPRLPTIWFNPQLEQNVFDWGLKAAHLSSKEKIQFLESLDVPSLTRFSSSPLLTTYVMEYLEYLRNADIDLFRRTSAPEIPSPTERFLLALSQAFSRSHIGKTASYWAIAGAFVRNPSLRQTKPGQPTPLMIADSLEYLFRVYKVPPQTCTRLVQLLIEACIDSEDEIYPLIYTFYGVFPPQDLLLLLHGIAETARKGVYGNRYPETLFLRCIQLAFGFRTAFVDEQAQMAFFSLFLDTLLLNIERPLLERLEAQSGKYSFAASAEWQHYEPLYITTPADRKLSPLELFKLSQERRIAFRRIEKALQSNSDQHIVRAYTSYMTTLVGYSRKIPEDWQKRINAAMKEVNKNEAMQAVSMEGAVEDGHRQLEQQQEGAIVAPPSATWPLGLERVRPWWEQEIAFARINLALRSRNIGRIVSVVDDYEAILDRYCEESSCECSWFIAAACDFFDAFEELNEASDEEKAIELMSNLVKINSLLKLLARCGLPAPRLTLHEKLRVEAAEQDLSQQKRKRIKDDMLSLSTAVMRPPEGLAPDKVAPRGFWQKLLRRH